MSKQLRVGADVASRCYRLEKECAQSVSNRRRVSRRGTTPCPADLERGVEEMEHKTRLCQSKGLENTAVPFVNTLGINTPAQSSDSQMSQSVGVGSSAACTEQDTASNGEGYSHDISALATSGKNIFLTALPFDRPSVLSSPLEPTVAQAEECLLVFRKRMLVFFPFIYLPPQTTARQLREWSPLLWFSIMAITVRPGPDEFAMTESIKQFVAQQMVVENQKNLDLLLGLLVFICWYVPFYIRLFLADSGFASLL